ncbi:MAG: DpnD/PcfM family protein [Oscillospiraceae bacterium]
MEYRVQITEYLQRTFTVEAGSEEEAIEIIEDRYDNSDIILDADDFTGRDIDIVEDGEE